MVQTRSQSIGLLSLPLELQTAILKELLPDSIEAVRAILLTCRQLYKVALPLSVHTFRCKRDDGDSDDNDSDDDSAPRDRAYLFLKYVTILKPFLAASVKQLICTDFTTREDHETPPDNCKRKLTAAERQCYDDTIRKVFADGKVEGRGEWIKQLLADLETGLQEPVVVLLLAACRNLEDFCYGEPFRPNLLAQFVKAAAESASRADSAGSGDETSPLANLRSVYHESTENKYGYLCAAEHGAPFFTLPRVSSYECVMINGGDEEAKAYEDIPRRSSAVQHITFRNGCVSGPTTKAMFDACKALRSFDYSHGIYHMCDGQMTAEEIMTATLPHAETLEHMDLNFDPDWQIGWEDRVDEIYFGTRLQQLGALKVLKATAQMLTGILDDPENSMADVETEIKGAPRLVECLPGDLEHLEIYRCGKKVLDQLQELLDEVSSAQAKFQNLRFIRFLFLDKSIEAEDIKLTCNAPLVTAEAVIQSREQDEHDRQGGRGSIMNLCTRIHNRTSRDEWLANLGSGQKVKLSHS